jgi:transposase
MIRIEKLTVDEKWAIKRQIKYTKLILVREKGQAVLMSDSGLSIATISDIVGKDLQTIRSWLKDWRQRKFASLFSGHEANENAAKLTREEREQLGAMLQAPPSEYGIPKEFWDVPTLKMYVSAFFCIKYSRAGYYLLLNYSDLSFKHPATFDVRRDEVVIKARIKAINREIKPILKDSNWELFCADEVRVEQEAEIRRAWLKKGEKTVIRVNREKNSQSYIGFLNQKDARCFLYKLNWQNSEEILKALKKLLLFFPGKRVAIIWDNAKWHFSERIKAELRTGGSLERVHLIAMPPYAPDENPIEHVWNEAKRHSANIQYDTFAQTKNRFENFVRNKPFKYTFRGVSEHHLLKTCQK